MSTKDIQAPRDIPSDVGIVGVGAIAGAIVTGLCEGAGTPTAIHLSPRSAGRASRLATRYPSVHVADSNQTVLVRAIPLPAVARRSGLTAIHPPHELARAIFDPLGGVVAVEDERVLEGLSASTATIAAHLAYLDTISRWVADRGIRKTDAARYVAAVFASLSETLLVAQPIDLGALADEYATAGGINEQFLTALTRAGTFDTVKRALDDVAVRLEGE